MKRLNDIVKVFVFVFVLVEMMACNSTYPSLTYEAEGERNKNEEQYGKLVIAPTLDLNALFYTSAISSKGSGAFSRDNEALFNKQFSDAMFRIMGYRYTVTSSGDLSSQPNFSALYSETAGHKDCIMGSTSTLLGEVAKADSRGVLTMYDDEDLTSPRTYYYSEAYPKCGYDFFAYYLDDATKGTPVASSDRITLPLTVDGTQDVMSGYSKILSTNYLKEYGLTGASAEVINNILAYGDLRYSTYGALYGLQPKIELKHAFARILFSTLPAGDRDDLDLTITGVKVHMQTHGNLTIAAHEPSNTGYAPTGDYEYVSLRTPATYDETTGQIIPGQEITPQTIQSGDPETSIGEILVPAGTNYYDIALSCTETLQIGTNPDGTPKYITVSYEGDDAVKSRLQLGSGKVFEGGKEYYVHLNVYGASEIKVYVGNTKWEYGGDTDINIGD